VTAVFRQQMKESELQKLLDNTFVNINGYSIRPSDQVWILSNNSQLHIRIETVTEVFPEEIQPYFRVVLAHFAKDRSAYSVSNVCKDLKFLFARFPNESVLSESGFLTYLSALSQGDEHKLSRIRGFLRFWYDIGYYGVSKEFLSSIADFKLEGNEKFKAILTSDPNEGPFTPIETQAILDSMNNALSAGSIDVTDYFALYLLLTTAQRPIQLMSLRFSDFYQKSGKFYVNIPRAKQRGVPFRGSFDSHEVPEDVHIAMRLHRHKVYEQIGEGASSIDLPVFPNYRKFEEAPIAAVEELTLDHYAPAHHLGDGVCRRAMQLLGAMSERTGETIHLTPKRFRSTMGTDMAREGFGAAPIASKLGHVDLQHTGAYVQSSPEFAEVINKAVGATLAPLAQAFAGTLIRDEEEALRGNDPTSRIRTTDGSKGVGNCGSFGFCGVNAPVGCYTCNRFQPWVDAPHQEVMDALLEERQQILDLTGDKTVAAQLDRSILAAADVIQQCGDMGRAE